MAVSGKRRSKTNVFWVRDPKEQGENIVKVHIPGLMLESSSDVQHPMVRKPIHLIKPKVVTLQKSFHSSLKRRQQFKEAALAPNDSKHGAYSLSASSVSTISTNNKEQNEKSKRQFSLKELNPEDKKRVANLVKELAKAGEERHRAEQRLQEERMAFEERLAIIQDEYDGVIKEKQYMQKRFLELQSLLVKYQSNGRMPSLKKAVESQGIGTINNEKVQGMSSRVQHLGESSSVQIPGNDRPDKGGVVTSTSGVRTGTGNTDGFPQTLPREEASVDRVTMVDASPRQIEAVNSRSSPFQGSITTNEQLTSPDNPTGSCFGKLNASHEQDNTKRMDVVESSVNGTPSMSQATAHIDGQSAVNGIPPSLGLKEELPYNLSKASAVNSQASFAVKTHFPAHGSYPQSTMNPESGASSQPSLQGQAESSAPELVWINGRMHLSKNDGRSLSELSGVPGSFSAELDAMYRLYCRREYELQFQLQQQQIELQRQQLQLQQQLQQVEVMQQQQQQQQQQQHHHQYHLQTQLQPSTDSQSLPQLCVTAEIPSPGGVDKQAKPSISAVPNPTAEHSQVSHTRSPIPTSEDRSVIPSEYHTSDVQGAAPRATSRLHVVHSQQEAEVLSADNDQPSSRTGKENRDSLADQPGPVLPYHDHNIQPALRDFKASAGDSKQDGVVSEHESSRSSPRSLAGESGDQSKDTLHSLLESWREESMSGDRPLPRTRAPQIISSGRTRSISRSQEESMSGDRPLPKTRAPQIINSCRTRSIPRSRGDVFVQENARCNQANFSTLSERSSNGLREVRHETYTMHSQSREEFKRDDGDSELRYSLYSGVGHFEKKPRDHKALEGSPDADEFMSLRQRFKIEGSSDDAHPVLFRDHLQGIYPRSLVDIVEGLEDVGMGQQTSFLSTPRLTGELDTSDSGYSPERGSKDNFNGDINTDEEEATVLEDIFFLAGRF